MLYWTRFPYNERMFRLALRQLPAWFQSSYFPVFACLCWSLQWRQVNGH